MKEPRIPKFKVGDTAYHLYIDDINNPNYDIELIEGRISKVEESFVSLEHLVDGKWVPYEDGSKSFHEAWIFHTKEMAKDIMAKKWDRSEMYEKEIAKIERKISRLTTELNLLKGFDVEHKSIVERIKQL